jgi:tetratricopeptide (TPR) repeat protein
VDLLLAARARGYQVRLLDGTEDALYSAVRAGIPPVLLLRVGDFPGRRRDVYHYVVVDGTDERGRRVRVLLGDGDARWITTARLERPWRGSGHALLLVSRRPPSADALAHAVALERAGRLDDAAGAYRTLLEQAPSSLLWTNLGNVETSRGHLDRADAAYARALSLSPDAPEVLASLAWLRFLQGRSAEAEALAERAARSPGPVAGLALDTVARARLAQGRCREAASAFRASLETLAPGSQARPAAEEGLRDATACSTEP